jgi:hypothetical protein
MVGVPSTAILELRFDGTVLKLWAQLYPVITDPGRTLFTALVDP